jgi:hypothetical protein
MDVGFQSVTPFDFLGIPAVSTGRRWHWLIVACFIAILANDQFAVTLEPDITASHVAVFDPPRFFEGINKIYDSVCIDGRCSLFEPVNCIGSKRSRRNPNLSRFAAWTEMRSSEIFGGDCFRQWFFKWELYQSESINMTETIGWRLPSVLNHDAVFWDITSIQFLQFCSEGKYICSQLPLSSSYLQVSNQSEESGNNNQQNSSNSRPNFRLQIDDPFNEPCEKWLKFLKNVSLLGLIFCGAFCCSLNSLSEDTCRKTRRKLRQARTPPSLTALKLVAWPSRGRLKDRIQ